MLWLTLSLLSAFSQATADAFTKRVVKDADTYMVAWLRNMAAVPFLVVALFFIPMPKLDSTFYWAVGLSLPLEVVASLLYVKALEVSPISLTMPFQALTPLYLLATSFFMLGEVPSPAGAAGVCLLGVGAYLLNAHALKKNGIFAPFKAIYREKGSMMMMGVAAIYALTSDLGKLAIIHSSPVFFGSVYVIIFSFFLGPFAFFLSRKKRPVETFMGSPRTFVFIGLIITALVITQTLALNLTQVSYMIAVKRTSLLFSIGYGWWMFREENIRERLVGGSVMLAGLVLMVLG